jgi:dipeptide transport system substrate-binding protein
MQISVKKLATVLSVLVLATSAHWAIADKGTFVYCSEGSPAGFDSSQYTSGIDFNAGAYALFDKLVAYKPGTSEIIPSLAESWDVSPDGKTYTFHLRPNVQFHSTDYFKPTRNFQAEDVLFTFGRMIKKDHPSNRLYPAEYPNAVDMGLTRNIVSIKKTDNLTVEFKLQKVDAPFLKKIAVPFAMIHSAEYAQQLANRGQLAQLNQKPIGTGPFIFSSYAKDEAIRYLGNKNYWDADAVKIDKLVFSIVPDAAVRYQKMKKGECDLIGTPNFTDIDAMRKEPDFKVQDATGVNIGYLAYNTEKPETKKLAVRQALDMAINRQALVEAAYGNQGVVAINPYPAALWSHNASVKNAPFNIEKAKALLAQAGYPNGFETDLWTTTHDKSWRRMAEMIQADWAKIGVKANIVSYETAEFLKRISLGEYTTTLSSWGGGYADPDHFLGTLLTCRAVGGSNVARYCSAEYDALVEKAVTLTNQTERSKLYEQAQVILKRDLPWTTLTHTARNQPMRKSVQGYNVSPSGSRDFRYVSKSE